MKFEEKLQNLRKASSLSQEQLADKLGVSRQAVSKWESGSSYPEMDKLIAMCKIFKCSMDDLVNDNTTDKTIIKNKNIRKNTYIDSLLEFITKSVNMFCSMKFTSLLKCFIELCLIGGFLFIVVFLGNEILYEIINYIFYFNGNIVGEIITGLLSTLVFIILICIAVIIFIQVYKVRYLDYYDLLIYKYEQEKELGEEFELKETDINKNKKKNKIKTEEKRDHIIIRDPSHRPFEFLSVISKFIMGIIKFFVLCFSISFVITLILFVICLVIGIFLSFKNLIFFGITLGILGLIVFNIIILWLVYDFITNKKVPAKNIFIIFLGSVIISSIGAGISLISLKNFEFIEGFKGIEENVILEKTYDYNDELDIDLFNHDNKVQYKIDNSLDDIKVVVKYSSLLSEVSILEDEKRIYLDYNFNGLNFSNVIDIFLNDLENDIIRNIDNQNELEISIIANEKHLKKLLMDISKKYSIDVYKNNNQYNVYYKEIYSDNTICELVKEGYYKCVGLNLSSNIVKKDFKYEYKNNKLSYDSKKYYCYFSDYEESYDCKLHEEVYNG